MARPCVQFVAAAFLTLCVLLPGFSYSDIGRYYDGTIRRDFMFSTISNSMMNGRSDPSFFVFDRAIEGSLLRDFRYVEFRYPMDLGPNPRGRPAHITMQAPDGSQRTLYHHIAVSAHLEGNEWSFTYRTPLSEPGENEQTVSMNQVTEIRFPPKYDPWEVAEEDIIRDREEYVNRGGSLGRIPAEVQGEETDTEFKSTDNYVDQITGISAVYGDQSPFKSEEERQSGMMDLGNPTSDKQILNLGLFVLSLLVVGLMMLTFIVGTFIIKFAASNEGIDDLTMPRAIMTSAMLAFIPPSLFLAPISIFLVAPMIPISVLMIAGLFAFWFSAKIIIASMLEVMEGKAFDIMLQFYGVLVLVGCGIWIYFLYAT